MFAVMASNKDHDIEMQCIQLKAGSGEQGNDGVTCASSCCNDQSSRTLGNAQSLKVCTVSSSELCLTSEFTFIDGICVVQVSKTDATEETFQFL